MPKKKIPHAIFLHAVVKSPQRRQNFFGVQMKMSVLRTAVVDENKE